MAHSCTTSTTDWKDFLFLAIVLASWAVVSVSWYPGEQRSLNDRNILQWSWWVQACQTLTFYNQSSLKRHFQPHQPWMLVFSLLGVLVAVSATCVDRMVFFPLGWGGGKRHLFFSCSPWRKTFPLKEGGVYSGRRSSLRSCFPWSLKTYWD